MKNIEMLERLNAMKKFVSYDADAAQTLEKLIADVEADIRQETAASRGNGAAQRIITKMLKANREFKPEISYQWIDAKNRQCAIDGHRGFRFKDHLPLEERPKDCGDHPELSKIYPSSDVLDTKYLPIKLPSAADIKIEIAKQKSLGFKRNYYYDFGADLPVVNAQYLLDIITVLPDADTIWYSGILSPMFVFTDRADAILCTIKMDKKSDEKTLAAQELHRLLREYRENAHKESEYSLSLEQFAHIAKLHAKVSA